MSNKPKTSNEHIIFEKAAEFRIFLHIHGFLLESENDKVRERINKYAERMKLSKIKTIK